MTKVVALINSHRYTQEHYEDVAVLLHFHHDINVSGSIAIATLAGHFADLFTADNPRKCSRCWRKEGTPDGCYTFGGEHSFTSNFTGSFDRARFLAACGLES